MPTSDQLRDAFVQFIDCWNILHQSPWFKMFELAGDAIYDDLDEMMLNLLDNE